jgi:hypothetical protein
VDAVDDAADDVGRLVAEERRGEHLDLVIRLQHERARGPLPEGAQQVDQVAAEVAESPLELQVEHDVDERGAQSLLQRVVRLVRRRVGVDVLGGDRRTHEDEAVVEVRAVQDLHRHRVEERLGALGLLVIDQERDVMPLDLLPERIEAGAVEQRDAELALDALGGLVHAPIVEVDAIAPTCWIASQLPASK